MTIATEITRINGNIAAAYTAANAKGATLPETENSANLATCIDSIITGSTPVIESLSITPTTSNQTIIASSGTDGYSPINIAAVTSSIDANITAGNIKKGVSILGVNGSLETGLKANYVLKSSDGTSYTINAITKDNNVLDPKATNIATLEFIKNANSSDQTVREVNLSSLEQVTGESALSSSFYGCSNLVKISLLSLASISGKKAFESAFNSCTGLVSISFPMLTTISGDNSLQNAFKGCTSLSDINFPVLTTISSVNMATFKDCTSLTSVNFPSLTSLTGNTPMSYTFDGCTALTTVYFPALTSLDTGYIFYFTFNGCTGLTNVYFNGLTTTSFESTTPFNSMLSNTGTNVVHTIHFPSNLESTIQGLNGYPNFSGTSGYVTLAFDLPATS